MANVIYNSYKTNLVTQAVDVSFSDATSGFGVLLTSGYRALAAETDSWTTISPYEITTQADYGRIALDAITVTSAQGGSTTTDDYIVVSADDTSFGDSVSLEADGAVIYRYLDTTTSAAPNDPDAIIAFVDFGSVKSSTSGSYTIVWNAAGILNYKQGS